MNSDDSSAAITISDIAMRIIIYDRIVDLYEDFPWKLQISKVPYH